VYSAHLVPATNGASGVDETLPYEYLEPTIPAHLDTDFSALIESLESEMARVRQTAGKKLSGRDRALLIGVTTGDMETETESLAELHELAASADVIVLDTIVQRRQQIDP